MLHFIGFKDDRVWNARKIWGEPDFYHRNWDMRARQVDRQLSLFNIQE